VSPAELGAAAGRRSDWLLPLDRVEGAQASRYIATAEAAEGAGQQLRMAVSRRPVAHRHLTTQPYRPRTNGKVERFHQTMAREWAYGLAYRSHRHRNAASHTGSTTTAGNDDHTTHSETGPRSAAFTTSLGKDN
jgi:hypothetical protein